MTDPTERLDPASRGPDAPSFRRLRRVRRSPLGVVLVAWAAFVAAPLVAATAPAASLLSGYQGQFSGALSLRISTEQDGVVLAKDFRGTAMVAITAQARAEVGKISVDGTAGLVGTPGSALFVTPSYDLKRGTLRYRFRVGLQRLSAQGKVRVGRTTITYTGRSKLAGGIGTVVVKGTIKRSASGRLITIQETVTSTAPNPDLSGAVVRSVYAFTYRLTKI